MCFDPTHFCFFAEIKRLNRDVELLEAKLAQARKVADRRLRRLNMLAYHGEWAHVYYGDEVKRADLSFGPERRRT